MEQSIFRIKDMTKEEHLHTHPYNSNPASPQMSNE